MSEKERNEWQKKEREREILQQKQGGEKKAISLGTAG